MTVQIIDYPNTGGPTLPERGDNPRVETGAVQFGNDWPGLFIRGDNAAELMMHIRQIAKAVEEGCEKDLMLKLAMDNLLSIADEIDENVIVKRR
ncbi:MAG: hypothetical protein ACYSWP_19410 [Planctomycetota bacterium]|jgi:hypothetical protein